MARKTKAEMIQEGTSVHAHSSGKDHATKAPAKEECVRVFERCRELGLLLGKGGLHGNVLRIKPPMCLTAADADFMLEALDAAFREI